jgi:hypothetical protein
MSEVPLLKINTMANNGVIALEYLFQCNVSKFKELIKDGIELLTMIEDGEHIDDVISYDQLQIWEFMKLMKWFFKEELLSVIKQSKEIKLKLIRVEKVYYPDCEFSIEDIRKMQEFFNHLGNPFLGLALRKQQLRSQLRQALRKI